MSMSHFAAAGIQELVKCVVFVLICISQRIR